MQLTSFSHCMNPIMCLIRMGQAGCKQLVLGLDRSPAPHGQGGGRAARGSWQPCCLPDLFLSLACMKILFTEAMSLSASLSSCECMCQEWKC